MAFKSYYKLVKYENPNKVPFYVEDVSGQGGTLSVNTFRSDATNVEYSTDGQTWSSTNPNLSANGRVYIRANATTWERANYQNSVINTDNNFKIGGNIMSLFYGSNFTGNEISLPSGGDNPLKNFVYNNTKIVDASALLLPITTMSSECCTQMFYGCTALTTAPAILPATTLAYSCYGHMFKGCTALTTTPELPATTMANRCYEQMFVECTSLTQAPLLPATTLAENCYMYMFSGCTSLNSVTCLATNISDSNWTYDWLNNVSATGTFYKSPNMSSWTTGVNGIPSGWTVQDAQ